MRSITEGTHVSIRQKILPAAFLAITVVATVSLVGSTLNYIEFFTALQDVDFAILDMTLDVGENTVNITLVFAITNPTGYSGLRLRELSNGLYYKEANSEDQPIGLDWWTRSYRQQPKPLDRYSNITVEESIHLGVSSMRKRETERFLEFYGTHQQNLMWVLKSSAIFVTFAGDVIVALTASKTIN